MSFLGKGAGVIVECKNKILLLKRSKEDSAPGKWCIPGGAVEEGETFEEAARRELEEETGYKVEKLEDLGFFYHGEELKDMKFRGFRIKIEKEFKPILNNENSDFIWVDIKNKLKDLDLIFEPWSTYNFERIYPELKDD